MPLPLPAGHLLGCVSEIAVEDGYLVVRAAWDGPPCREILAERRGDDWLVLHEAGNILAHVYNRLFSAGLVRYLGRVDDRALWHLEAA